MGKVALIAPSFFGYRDKVAAELRRNGHNVECFNDRPSESVAFKSIAKISYKLLDVATDRYCEQLAEALKAGSFVRVIYMGGMSFCFSRSQFEKIRSSCEATFVAYLWDSLKNCKRFSDSIDLFDKVLSFDPSDCDGNVSLRPLFFDVDYSSIKREDSCRIEYDACFVGSVHQTEKFHAIASICNDLEAMGLRIFKYFYVPSRSVELLRKASDSKYRRCGFSREPLNAQAISELYSKSKAIIDAPQAGQRGLTMRTIETVGARRKLITTNSDVENYDFSNYGNVAVWRRNGDVADSFFNRPFKDMPTGVYESYSISSFARSLVGEGESYIGYSVKENK